MNWRNDAHHLVGRRRTKHLIMPCHNLQTNDMRIDSSWTPCPTALSHHKIELICWKADKRTEQIILAFINLLQTTRLYSRPHTCACGSGSGRAERTTFKNLAVVILLIAANRRGAFNLHNLTNTPGHGDA
jgi:hypothetical protein